MNFITRFFEAYSPNISEKSKALFEKNVTLKNYKKGDVIVGEGHLAENFYLLKSGVIRSFDRDANGKEYIRTLYVPITTCGPLSSLITKKPSTSVYECLTDCEILVGDYPTFIRLTEKHHDLSQFYSRVLENVFLRTEKRVHDLTVLNSTERYIKLKNDIPNIDNLIQQYHIASFLNITPVQLSRIRKELYSK